MQKRVDGLVGAQTTAVALLLKIREAMEITEQLEREAATDLQFLLATLRTMIVAISERFDLT